MGKQEVYTALVLVVIALSVGALPAPRPEEAIDPEDVEIVKSEELPFTTKSIGTYGDSGKRDVNEDPPAEQKYIQEESQGARGTGVVQTVLQNILQPQPIVDTISEEDKYGNTGDSLGALGRGIVGGSEALSNFVNLAIEYPTNLFKSLAHRATEALNHLGSRLVGL